MPRLSSLGSRDADRLRRGTAQRERRVVGEQPEARLRYKRREAFKWRASGKWRLHERPNSAEVVALGATAAQALLGRAFRVTKDRGKLVSSALADRVVATVHPSSILRAPDDDSRRAEMRAFVRDLKASRRLREDAERSLAARELRG